MKKLLHILLAAFLSLVFTSLSFHGYGQTTSLNYGIIPTSATDLQRPGAGANEWSYDQNVVNIPVQGTNTQRLDRYWRFTWLDFQAAGSASNAYNFATFDSKIQQSISRGQGFSFGVMQECTGCDLSVQNNIGGTQTGPYSLLPTYLHTQMQSEPNKDYLVSGNVGGQPIQLWLPAYSSPSLVQAMRNLNDAIYNHIMTTSFNGVRYRDVIDFIDIRGVGDFGEWTNNDFTGGAGTIPNAAQYDSIAAATFRHFPTFQCVAMIASFDGNQLSNTMIPPATGFFILTSSNVVGVLGWRRDNWGQIDPYIQNWLNNNNTTFGGITFKDSIMARYKYAPIVGEPQDGGTEANFSTLPPQATQYGGNSFGNGNFNNGVNATIQNNIRAASKAFGYRLILNPGGSTTTAPAAGGAFSIVQHWRNVGASPCYQNWNVVYDFRVTPTSTPIIIGTSSFNPRLFSPAGADNVVTDNFTLTGVAAGTYELHMTFKDPLNYRFPMPIYITNTQQADGSYIIQTGIVVTASGASANAGPNQSITVSSATLSGTSSVGATSYLWTNISGPNTPTITSATSSTTTVTGLITGTYIFQLGINGGTSGNLIDQIQVIVNAPVVQANAGNNQTITLPTTSALLSGAASTGATTYSWTNSSGPNTPTLVTPTGTTTAVTGLIAGTYVFQLSINAGASTSTTQVKVLPVPAPIANAGVSQTITLPTASVTLDGTGSSGNITSYAWTATGPNTPVFGTPTASTSTFSGLIQGTYLVQLALNGGVSTDTMRVFVNPAAPPIPTGQTIFTTQTPVGGVTAATENDGPQAGLTGIELGVKFRTSVNGFVLGIRYYRTPQNNPGIHIGELYLKSSGARLGAATFVNESLTGWQTVVFATPIAVTAGTTYVAAYFSPNGNYISTLNGLNTAIVNGQLTALASGTDGVNGVYNYANTPTFPTLNFQKSNYWVDIIFSSPNTNPCNCHPRNKFTKQVILNGF